MSASGSRSPRPAWRSALALAACFLALGAGSSMAAETPSPDASIPAASSPVPATSPVASPDVMVFPLPEIVAQVPPDIPTVSIEPTSGPSLEVGETVPYTLPHCGLLSPVDVDGSLWQPVAGVDASGGPIDSDDETGELINATSGQFTLVAPDTAHFSTPMGSIIVLERAEGALDYPLCM